MVRQRVDGVLHEVQRLPRRLGRSVLTRLKVLAKLDIAEPAQTTGRPDHPLASHGRTGARHSGRGPTDSRGREQRHAAPRQVEATAEPRGDWLFRWWVSLSSRLRVVAHPPPASLPLCACSASCSPHGLPSAPRGVVACVAVVSVSGASAAASCGSARSRETDSTSWPPATAVATRIPRRRTPRSAALSRRCTPRRRACSRRWLRQAPAAAPRRDRRLCLARPRAHPGAAARPLRSVRHPPPGRAGSRAGRRNRTGLLEVDQPGGRQPPCEADSINKRARPGAAAPDPQPRPVGVDIPRQRPRLLACLCHG